MLVAAPTGSGKTLVGEFAVHLALQQGRKCFYTTPIKALSNQKYGDLVRRYGADQVGLLTGDNTINGEAPIVVMTTEVLRNMLYAGSSTLTGLGFVVMDEVHYLADRFRGAVWEEVIIHLPESVALVSLSATVSNAEEFGEWLETVRGETATIVEERRPVPLYQHVMVGTADVRPVRRRRLPRRPPQVNPELMRVARDDWRRGRTYDRRPPQQARRAAAAAPAREVRAPARPSLPSAARRRGAARRAGPAAGDRVRVQPGRLRRRGHPVPEREPAAHLARGARRRSARSSRNAAAASPTRTCTCWATTTSSRGSRAASRPTTPACCPPSRSASRSCSPPGCARWCSPPRRWRSASTCRPARW